MRLLALIWVVVTSAAFCGSYDEHGVKASGLEITLNSYGEILRADTEQPQRATYDMWARAGLSGVTASGTADFRSIGKRGFRSGRELGSSASMITRIEPGRRSVRWTIEIIGKPGEKPFSAPIETSITFASKEPLLFWTAWAGGKEWRDPLVPKPFTRETYEYGSFFNKEAGIALPIATFIDPKRNRAISFVQSPEDTLLTMEMRTYPDHTIVFSRTNHRIDSKRPVRFTIDIIEHDADPRAALAWMVEAYPQFFNPSNPIADEVGGGAAYSGYEGPFDADRAKQMSYRVNWKASIDFPYMGMFLPPVKPDFAWNKFAGGGRGKYGPQDEGRYGQTSISQLADYSKRMKKAGFEVLSYFNVTEFGGNIEDPPSTRALTGATSGPLWLDPNAFLYRTFPKAILYAPGVRKTWGGAVAMDCGDPTYREFLLEQARRHIREIPDAIGICIDRMDWLRQYNRKADDGVSWYNGPVRFVGNSWKRLMAQLGPMMHNAGKVIFVNPHVHRIDFMEQVDGIYDEFGDGAQNLNGSSLIALRRPVMSWVHKEDVLTSDPDTFFQRYLYMGSFLTVPVTGNDHTIVPSTRADELYLRYGPLFNALHGRKWVLTPRPVSVESATTATRANIFEVPGGYAIPVVFGGSATSARVIVRATDNLRVQKATVIHPGELRGSEVKVEKHGKDLAVDCALTSGCAVVELRTSQKQH